MDSINHLMKLPSGPTRAEAEAAPVVRALDPPPAKHRGRPPVRLIPGTSRRTAQYMREKALGIRHENGAQKLKFLTARHLQIINYHISGLSMEKISELMNISMSTTWRVLNDPLAKAFLQNVYAARQMEIDALLGQSVDAVRTTLETGNTREKLQAVSAYSKLKQTIAGDTNPAKTAEDVAQQIIANAQNLQLNIFNGTGK